jgi:DNA-directed RNA polymerase subunit RPC12/RpoP
MTAKCSCQHCNGHIEFERDQERSTVACPHCGMDTLLFVTTPPVIQPHPMNRRLIWPWVLAGSLITLIAAGTVCVAAALHFGWFDKDRAFDRARAALDAGQKPDAILRDVQGVYGWTLGDILPSQFNVTTNEYGEIQYVVPYQDQVPTMWLVLTEERRIAAIYVSISENEQKDAVFDALREKYGFREIHHNSLQGDYTAYFGTTNRQAVFDQMLSVFTHMSVEYRDEPLCKIADDQTEKRHAAAEKQKADAIKSQL